MDYAGAGERLRRRRKELGLLQREVAPRFGVSAAQISRWESGKQRIEEQHHPALAKFLGITVAEAAVLTSGAAQAERQEFSDRLDAVVTEVRQNAEILRNLVLEVGRLRRQLGDGPPPPAQRGRR